MGIYLNSRIRLRLANDAFRSTVGPQKGQSNFVYLAEDSLSSLEFAAFLEFPGSRESLARSQGQVFCRNVEELYEHLRIEGYSAKTRTVEKKSPKNVTHWNLKEQIAPNREAG